jgi:hypothetical protein
VIDMGPEAAPYPHRHDETPLLGSAVLAEAVTQQSERCRLGLPESETEPFQLIVELNLRYRDGLQACAERFRALYARVFAGTAASVRPPVAVDATCHRCQLSVAQARALALAEADVEPTARTMYRIWPDFPIEMRKPRNADTTEAEP